MGNYNYYIALDGIIVLDMAGNRARWLTDRWFNIDCVALKKSMTESKSFYTGELLESFDSLDNPIEVMYG